MDVLADKVWPGSALGRGRGTTAARQALEERKGKGRGGWRPRASHPPGCHRPKGSLVDGSQQRWVVGFDTGAAFHQAAPSHQSLGCLAHRNQCRRDKGARRLESGEAAAMTSISSENRARMVSRSGGKQRRTSDRLIWLGCYHPGTQPAEQTGFGGVWCDCLVGNTGGLW